MSANVLNHQRVAVVAAGTKKQRETRKSGMMWNWLGKLMGKESSGQRRRVQVDIPFEQILSRPPEWAQQPVEAEADTDAKES